MPGKYPTPRGQSATDAKRRYNQAHYAHIHLTVKPEEKANIQTTAKCVGQSVNAFINQAISERIERMSAEPETASGADPENDAQTPAESP